MAEAAFEAVLVMVVANLQQAVLDAERVAVVVAQLVMRELRRPARQVPAVEQLDPVRVRDRVLDRAAAGRAAGDTSAEEGDRAERRCDTHRHSIVVTSSS